MALSKRQIADLAQYSTEQLRTMFDAIGSRPDHRVKAGRSKGHVKLVWARRGDIYLAELHRRAGGA